MTNTPTSGAADLPEALTADQWLDLAIRHANKDWNSAQPDGYANAVKALCADFAALTAQDPSQPGGFDAGDMASAAAQGYRDGWTAAQADNQQAVAPDERDDFEKVFPLPSGCIRVGTGYASTGYSNWAAHTHCERWQGWQARAARSPADSVLEDAEQGAEQFRAGQASTQPVEKWSDRVQRAHPKSEPEFWPDELRLKYMAEEIADLRAARDPADSVTAPAGGVVAYLDIGAGGYLDLGSDLSNEAISRLPKGRHALIVAGTYGIDGYTPTPPTQAAGSVLEDAARYRWLREGNDAKHGAAWYVAVNLYGCEWDAAIDAAMNKGGAT